MALLELAQHYEKIAELLARALREEWTEIRLHVERLEEGAVRLQAEYDRPEKDEPAWMDPPTGIAARLSDELEDLAEVASDTEKGLYRRCDLTLRADGSYDVNFTYEDA